MSVSISIDDNTIKKLDKFRINKNESYESIFNRLLSFIEEELKEDELDLSEDTIKELEIAKKEVEKGEYFSLEDVEQFID